MWAVVPIKHTDLVFISSTLKEHAWLHLSEHVNIQCVCPHMHHNMNVYSKSSQ